MPADLTPYDTDLYAALIAERYGRPLADILQEAAPRPVQELLKEQRRRPAKTRRPPTPIPSPDPNAAEHCAIAYAATAPRRRRNT
ncbi:hypothetical protein OG897_26975 [Streptomyces sp. NBC_00237]|uniref:hypothetical protein n=1 Tax=Streptomyces sp. NBC_00237 TaxID=2975687 RepID=UPI00224CEE62|nr:hypothetical protein [Streptomyces sp. NBC_00237]MCX5205086.1 hypothetical protein [Streptomyces sp. NBC_00237]